MSTLVGFERSPTPALLGLAIVLLSGCQPPAPPEPPEATTALTLHGVGFVEPAGEVRRLAFVHAGVIQECAAEPGACVSKGMVLARQRTAEDQAALDIAEAEVALAEARLEALDAGVHPAEVKALEAREAAAGAEAALARQAFDRRQRLVREGAATPSELEDAEARLQVTEAMHGAAAAALQEAQTRVRSASRTVARRQIEVARNQAKEIQLRLEARVLRAPSDGMVLEILRRGGERISEGADMPVLLFADVSRLRVRAEIDETQALALRAGARAGIRAPGLGDVPIAGLVTLVKPVMGPKTLFSHAADELRDLEVRQALIDLPESTTLPIGLKVDVEIEGIDPILGPEPVSAVGGRPKIF